MDDILGDYICRSSFGSKNHCNRCFRLITGFNIKIFINCIQTVHLLSLILMKPLDLNIKYRIGIYFNALNLVHIFCKSNLVFLLDLFKLIKYALIILVCHEFIQILGVLFKSASYQTIDLTCEKRIAMNQPSSKGYSISLIIKFLRIQFIEII